MGNFLSRLAERTLGLVAVAEPLIPARLAPQAAEDARPKPISVDPPAWAEREPPRAGWRDDSQEVRRPVPIRVDRNARSETAAGLQEPSRSTGKDNKGADDQELFRVESLSQRVKEGSEHDVPDPEKAQVRAQPAGVLRETEPRSEPLERAEPIRHVSTPVFANRSRVPAPRHAEEEASRIQISIGRIEIRAEVATASAPGPRRSRTATLSLNDYLRQQAEARR